MSASLLIRMSRNARAISRTRAISRHMISTSAAVDSKDLIAFDSNLAVRTYTLNRPEKLNALSEPMLNTLRPKIEEWTRSDLCGMIVARGAGKAFCAGGDVAGVVLAAENPETRNQAIDFFKREFELDYVLGALKKPYIAILDGITMGGGVGLAAPASFRVATEKTVFAMPETKIGYFPDVGASYYMSRLDGQLGTYLALTSETVRGRDLFELGFATHYIPSNRVPVLLEHLQSLERPTREQINETIETFSMERTEGEALPSFTGALRVALDGAFNHNHVDDILRDLQALTENASEEIRTWAEKTISTLRRRSPTSLNVALEAIRRGKDMELLSALNMEMKIAYAYCNLASPDFATGVHAVLIDKTDKTDKPVWSPATLEDVKDADLDKFFAPDSTYLQGAPELEIPQDLQLEENYKMKPMRYSLPTEEEIVRMVNGRHESSTGTALTKDELVQKFYTLRNGKLGVREKVAEVATRLCDVVDNANDGNKVWLKLKPQPVSSIWRRERA